MDQSTLFCSGQQLAELVVSVGLLDLAWRRISELCEAVDQNQESNFRFEIYPEAKCTIIAFGVPSSCTTNLLSQGAGSVSSTLIDGSSVFGFLCSRSNSSFSIHTPAIQLFYSVFGQLASLKSERLVHSEKSLIITGHSLGGSLASLFTLWLLDTIKPGTKRPRPLCITFGSPLVGDISLQNILENSTWNSCFLHVATTLDPVLKLLIPSTIFKPFGTFLLCSELGCTCLDDPEVVFELLVPEMSVEANNANKLLDGERIRNYYKELLKRLGWMLMLKGTSKLGELVRESRRCGMIRQLKDIGIKRIQEHQNTHDVIVRMEEREKQYQEKKKTASDPHKKLNDMKIIMANLEWYKKQCRNKGIGYYDYYKNQSSGPNMNIARFKKELNNYWISMIENAEKKPQSERAAMKKSWLYSGRNYRRMVEPLDIAEFYKKRLRDYRAKGRSQHYIQLEKLSDEETKPADDSKSSRKKDLTDLLTMDSCFWADVEEAMIICEFLKHQSINADERISLEGKLIEFEKYVMEMIENNAVSPEIFLRQSTFMRWWNEYKEIIGNYTSPFVEYMMGEKYDQYGKSD